MDSRVPRRALGPHAGGDPPRGIIIIIIIVILVCIIIVILAYIIIVILILVLMIIIVILRRALGPHPVGDPPRRLQTRALACAYNIIHYSMI